MPHSFEIVLPRSKKEIPPTEERPTMGESGEDTESEASPPTALTLYSRRSASLFFICHKKVKKLLTESEKLKRSYRRTGEPCYHREK
jgi:hypothetical protein